MLAYQRRLATQTWSHSLAVGRSTPLPLDPGNRPPYHLKIDVRSHAGGDSLVVGPFSIPALVVGILEHAVDRDAFRQSIGGCQRNDIVVGIEGTNFVGSDDFLIAAVRPTE